MAQQRLRDLHHQQHAGNQTGSAADEMRWEALWTDFPHQLEGGSAGLAARLPDRSRLSVSCPSCEPAGPAAPGAPSGCPPRALGVFLISLESHSLSRVCWKL